MNINYQISDPDYGGERLLFFNVEQPLTLSAREFEIKWKEVDNVWTQFGNTKKLKKDPIDGQKLIIAV